ncbi:MAG: tRNA-specific 2-thiouridylase MnmA [Pirellulaceae bacterium]|nr:MAG: tRNA-specific 2-thiouridylase MnmA [Pirellulaceae bacterium]
MHCGRRTASYDTGMNPKRVVLAMSGGVDSSAAAVLLTRQGFEVIGVFMRHGEESAQACRVGDAASPLLPVLEERTDHKQGCCSAADAMDARRVADRLGIPFYALDLQADFARIVDYFVDEYTHGRTPNPCVQCNNWIKFGRLFDYADTVEAQYVATGHYARLLNDQGGPGLYRGVDRQKDQSYVLAGIDRHYLSRMLLPVGEFVKPHIRQLAAEAGLEVATKRDSQEICFVTSGHHGQFVRARSRQATDGPIVTIDGKVVGHHQGIESFTIGQRKGLGVALGKPVFVVDIDAATNRVVLGPREALARTHLLADRLNWLTEVPAGPFDAEVQIRYNSEAVAARIVPQSDQRTVVVEFAQPAYGVAPGQLCVFYRQQRVLGGGWIQRAWHAEGAGNVPQPA